MAIAENTAAQYSLVAKTLHWLSALTVLFLFGLGLWMQGLDYYHQWYQTAPELHIGVGVCLAGLTLLRLIYRSLYDYPPPVTAAGTVSRLAARIAHATLYALPLALFASGYVIVTAEGEALAVFNWFQVPALLDSGNNIQDQAGVVHEWLAYGLVGLAAVHALAALYHHFVLADNTLLRMLTRAKPQREST